jgi:hypothetical protein
MTLYIYTWHECVEKDRVDHGVVIKVELADRLLRLSAHHFEFKAFPIFENPPAGQHIPCACPTGQRVKWQHPYISEAT